MHLINTASVRDRIEELQAGAEQARASRLARLEARLNRVFERAMEKDDIRTAVACIRTEAQISGLYPGRAMPLDIAPELVDTLDEYERFQARFATLAKPDVSPAAASSPGHTGEERMEEAEPAAATPTNPDISHATAPPTSPADAGEVLGRGPGYGEETQNSPVPPSPGRAGGGKREVDDAYVPEPRRTPEEWRARLNDTIPWWVPQELPRDLAWEYVAGFMAAPISLQGEEPDDAEENEGEPTLTNPDVSAPSRATRHAP
jgi:hypothetical protein